MSIIDTLRQRFRSYIPAEGDTLAYRGHQALDAGDFFTASELFQQAIQRGVARYHLAELYTLLGKCLHRLEQFDRAVAAHQQALALNPSYHQAWNNLGIAYCDWGYLNEAIRCHERAIEIEPAYAFAYASLGGVYIHKNEPQRAIALLERANQLHTGIAIAHANLALAYAMVARFDDAEQSLRHAVAFGYRRWQEIQQRIENLRAFALVNAARADARPPCITVRTA